MERNEKKKFSWLTERTLKKKEVKDYEEVFSFSTANN